MSSSFLPKVKYSFKRLGFIPTCEYVEGNKVHLGMAVLASLRGGHLHNLAWTILAKNMSLIQSPLNHTNTYLDHDKAALPERRALHGESLGGSRVSLVEVVVLVVGHFAAAVLRFSEIQVGYVELLSL